MGYTHFDKISCANGFAIGAKGAEKELIDAQGRLFFGFEPGNQFYVDSGVGSDSYDGLTWATALATVDAAIGKCTANNGDIVWVAPGHAETYTTTGAKITFDVAGVRVIGLGNGADRPTFSFGHTGTTMTMSAASVKFVNAIFVTAIDSVVTFMTISGNDCEIDIEVQDATDKEVVNAFTVTGDRFKANVLHRGYTAGNANLTTFSMNAVAGADINVVALGKAGTAVVNFVTAPSTNVLIKGIFLVTSTTDLSKNVVDTITGSTWQVQGFDLGAGCSFSGGSGATVQKDDVGAIAALVGTLSNSGGTATLGGILGDVANVSVATWLQKIGTLANTGGTATLGGILGDVANIGIATRLDSATKTTTIADATTIPNNSQAAAGLLATATNGAVLIEEIIWQRGADNLVGPTNYEFSTDNVNGLTGAAAPNGVALLATFNAQKTGILSIDGATKQIPFVLESGKKVYIHGDDAVTSAGGATNFYIKYRRLAANAYLA